MDKDALLELLDKARQAAQNAYAPYSGYKVGAALLDSLGKVHLGCNVENASYSLTNCAERTAIFKAVSEGVRDFQALAVWVDSDTIFPPCGACRQVISEFAPRIPVIFGNALSHEITDAATLLPSAFSLDK